MRSGEVRLRGGTATTEVAPGVMAPDRATVEAGDVSGYDVRIEVVLDGRRYIATAVHVLQRPGGPPVTGEAIRKVPVANIIRRGLPMGVTWVASRTGGVTRSTGAQMPENVTKYGPTDEALTWVARVYRLALLLDMPPTREVETSLRLPRSTAGRWVAAARDRGFLGTAEGPGKAGG